MARNSNYGSVGAAGSRALQELLMQRELQKRQALIDGLTVRQQDAEETRAQEEHAWKQQQAEAQRAATQQAQALALAKELGAGSELDPDAEARLRDGGLGSLIQQRGSRFTPNDAAAAPSQFTSPDLQPEAFAEQSTFKGTAAQDAEQARKAKLAEYLSKLPADSHVRQFLEAQDATGDNSLPPALFQPKETAAEKHSPAYVEYQDAKTSGFTGSFSDYQNADANRKRQHTTVTMGSSGLSTGAARREIDRDASRARRVSGSTDGCPSALGTRDTACHGAGCGSARLRERARILPESFRALAGFLVWVLCLRVYLHRVYQAVQEPYAGNLARPASDLPYRVQSGLPSAYNEPWHTVCRTDALGDARRAAGTQTGRSVSHGRPIRRAILALEVFHDSPDLILRRSG
jgi:hypothetical protein